MTTNQKGSGKAVSIAAGLMTGTAVSIFATIILSGVLGKMVELEKISWENIGYGIVVLVIASSYLGAAVAISKIKRQKLKVCLLFAAIYCLCLLMITALFFGGEFDSVGVTASLVLAGSISAVLLVGRGNGNKRRKGKIAHYC